ncbi:uncharacterized protein LOC119453523 isoform X1 [Dermacentor silvarum]|uniref:uncharacterized protein LOC119453523 isoform X1 n=1 Tax=Dermacentor silvarum TaxID=543639 RepID=UPI00210073B4|nr:uncharacterized protein LOC119453523 isoform X1 [Dermacentor silvarum]
MAAKAGASKQTSKDRVDDEHVEVLDDNAEVVANEMITRTTTFKVKTIQELMKLNFEDEKTRISADAVKLLAEFFRVFTMGPIAIGKVNYHMNNKDNTRTIGWSDIQSSYICSTKI